MLLFFRSSNHNSSLSYQYMIELFQFVCTTWWHIFRSHTVFQQLLGHFRFLLTLRSQEGSYRSLILLRLSDIPNVTKHDDSNGKKVLDLNKAVKESHLILPSYWLDTNSRQLMGWDGSKLSTSRGWYDMSHAEIEECSSHVVVACPWFAMSRAR